MSFFVQTRLYVWYARLHVVHGTPVVFAHTEFTIYSIPSTRLIKTLFVLIVMLSNHIVVV